VVEIIALFFAHLMPSVQSNVFLESMGSMDPLSDREATFVLNFG
jgi:hypothetical protein